MSVLLRPPPAIAIGNIYQDAIPHVKACISLIQEKEEQHKASDPVDLREVCPTLVDFLSYEPISEIDPPLENYTQRAYLESLLILLQDAKHGKSAALEGKFTTTPGLLTPIDNEPAQKPFFQAMAQWMFSHVQNLLAGHGRLSQPVYQQVAYIAVVNLVMVIGLAVIILFVINTFRNSNIYIKYFKRKWQQKISANDDLPSLDQIALLNLDQQIPALIQLIKRHLQLEGMLPEHNNISNSQLLRAATLAKPQYAREILRLLRLYDRLNYSQKTIAADEIHLAFEQACHFLMQKDLA